ncbi:valine--tRNA ligase [Patescibacteria group bacterium]|nr:valine--tRNA ligase [Patescibacteria group bacterium]MBU2159225.1 valine--tRNA ligase [Patescibacteria group bacterium]MBU2220966.1 valine--tRNA ligase [Patescibacteria group bacterium]
MDEKFLKPYDPSATEARIYAEWEESGYFNPDNLPDADSREPFTIVLPPPNVTGILHLGHAYEDSLQDSVIRFNRMRGKKALWIPGTDSAAIATQARVEKNIQKEEGKSRHDIGREELVKRVGEFARSSEQTILSQVRRMGASLDWSRYAYTLDDTRNTAVFTAFKRMYAAGLIYRGNRIVNWDPKGQTTISDDEIVHEERTATLYTFKYSKDFPIPVATTRLETKVGDVAVAVHPDDPRYKEFVGKTYEVVFCDVPLSIRIVADTEVDPEFGTGALGVTPAHSQIDWDIATRHDLPKDKIVINEYAKMTASGRVAGLKVIEARETVASWLREEGLMVSEESISQNVSTAERTGGIIEPLPKLQWFVGVDTPFAIEHSEIPGIKTGDTTTLKEVMRAAVESGAVSMPQENFKKIYQHWITNLHDWCISRQIWFGHRIPVWYREDEVVCQETAPEGDGWVQDPDVLDTWFSSALWTFSTLGWPEQTDDLRTFHPTSFMSPAYEILPLWVSRMILMSGFHLGQVPFKTVLIHGLVRDSKGQKFSKSLGNGIDPIEMIDRYGADALRMGLLGGAAVGSDVRFDENKVKGYKNFANKLWNITRYVLTETEGADEDAPLTDADQVLRTELDEILTDVTADFENYRMHLAAEKLYHYAWHRLADELIEDSKNVFASEDTAAHASRRALLKSLLADVLSGLHPFMPFVTEEIWKTLKPSAPFLMISPWPVSGSVE